MLANFLIAKSEEDGARNRLYGYWTFLIERGTKLSTAERMRLNDLQWDFDHALRKSSSIVRLLNDEEWETYWDVLRNY